jgi:hypothetical protein
MHLIMLKNLTGMDLKDISLPFGKASSTLVLSCAFSSAALESSGKHWPHPKTYTSLCQIAINDHLRGKGR